MQYTAAAINPRGDDDYDRTRHDEASAAYANILKAEFLQSLDLGLIRLSSGLGTAGTVGIALGILVLAMTAWICRHISRRARAERAKCAGLLFVSFALSSLGDAAGGDGTGVTGFIASSPLDSMTWIQTVATALGFAAGTKLAASVVALSAVKGWPRGHRPSFQNWKPTRTEAAKLLMRQSGS